MSHVEAGDAATCLQTFVTGSLRNVEFIQIGEDLLGFLRRVIPDNVTFVKSKQTARETLRLLKAKAKPTSDERLVEAVRKITEAAGFYYPLGDPTQEFLSSV